VLKYRLADLDGIARDVAAHYEQADDGSFVLRVEGMVAKARLDEFRENNIRLATERDQLAKALSADGRTQEIERLVSERTAEIQGRLNRTLVEKTITEVAVSRHVRKKAIPDVITRAQTVWSIGDDGGLVASTPDGGRAYHPDGDRPLSPDAWLDGLRTTAPHLFEASTGGGASGGGPGDGNAVRVRAKADLKSAKDKSDFIAKHGYNAFAQLPLNVRQ
jgi:hypothetical protein